MISGYKGLEMELSESILAYCRQGSGLHPQPHTITLSLPVPQSDNMMISD